MQSQGVRIYQDFNITYCTHSSDLCAVTSHYQQLSRTALISTKDQGLP